MKRRIGIVTSIAALLMLLGAGVWASQFLYSAQVESPMLVANASTASSTLQVSDEDGIVITSVETGSPAAEAGVKRGNILLNINDQEIKTFIDVFEYLDSLSVGDEVTLTLLHGDETRTLTVTTGERDGQPYLGITSCDGMPHIFEEDIFIDGKDPFFHDLDELDMSKFEIHTLLVEDIIEGSGAEAAGLQKGDKIVALDGVEATTAEAFVAQLLTNQPGDTVMLTIEREGEANPIEVEVTLGENKAGEAFLGIGLGVDVEIDIELDDEMDFHIGMMPYADFNHDQLPEGDFQGAIIDRIKEESAAEEAGLQEGDVITAIDNEPLTRMDSLISKLAAHQPEDTVTLSVWRNGETLDINVQLGASQTGKAQLGAQVGFIKVGKVMNGHEIEIEEEIMIDGVTK